MVNEERKFACSKAQTVHSKGLTESYNRDPDTKYIQYSGSNWDKLPHGDETKTINRKGRGKARSTSRKSK